MSNSFNAGGNFKDYFTLLGIPYNEAISATDNFNTAIGQLSGDFEDESSDVLNIKSGDVESMLYNDFEDDEDDFFECIVFLKKDSKFGKSVDSITGAPLFDVENWTNEDCLGVIVSIDGDSHTFYIDRNSVFAVSVSE